MSENTSRHVKYKESHDAYKATLYRSAFAIKGELEPGLKQAVQLSGASSVSGMLAFIARAPEECAELLKPIFERLGEQKKERRRHKVTIKSIVDEVKAGEFTPEQLQKALALVKSQKGSKESGE